MYRVTVTTDGKEYVLHDPRDDDMQFISADLSEEMGKHQTLAFTIPPSHPNKDKVVPMASRIKVYRDGELLTCCRLLNNESDFYNTGQATCEGESGYLLDSIQRPYDFAGNARDLFVQLINSHNAQVDEYKRMEPGNLDVTGDVTRSSTEYASTLSEIVAAFCTGTDCYYRLRYGSDGKKYLDCVKDFGGINKQQIRFGVNLISLNRRVDPQTLVTALIPTGEDVDAPDGSGNKKAADITSVNDGKDYIVNEAAVARHGMIWGQVKFDGVTDPSALMAKGEAYLDDAVTLTESIEVKAVDLSHVDKGAEPLKVGCWTDVVSKPHGLNTRMLLAKMVTSLTDPRKCEITLGSVRPTLTGNVAKSEVETSARINNVAASASKEINQKIENATSLITGGKGGYVVLDVDDPETGKRSLPWRILVMDAPGKEDAHNVIQINKNGLGFSTTGINGPYRNAWTIDGNLVADFITAGTMLADRIRGGTLELGGTGIGKDGSICVKDVSGREICILDKNGATITNGVINAPKIVGGSADFGGGLFAANEDTVYIGGFCSMNAWGRDVLQSMDGQCGISSDPSKRGRLWLWCGWKNEHDYDLCVNNRGEMHCKEIYIESNQDFWRGWNLSNTLKDVYKKMDDLRNRIDNIDRG